MTFDEWYETYERDGGELMLFNTLDLQAAYEAGYAEARAEVDAANWLAKDACDTIGTAIADTRRQTAKEAINYIRLQTGSDLYKWRLMKELAFKFGLEG